MTSYNVTSRLRSSLRILVCLCFSNLLPHTDYHLSSSFFSPITTPSPHSQSASSNSVRIIHKSLSELTLHFIAVSHTFVDPTNVVTDSYKHRIRGPAATLGVSPAHRSSEIPAPVFLTHEWPATVTMATGYFVLAAVSSAHHGFVVNSPYGCVSGRAGFVAYHWYLRLL